MSERNSCEGVLYFRMVVAQCELPQAHEIFVDIHEYWGFAYSPSPEHTRALESAGEEPVLPWTRSPPSPSPTAPRGAILFAIWRWNRGIHC